MFRGTRQRSKLPSPTAAYGVDGDNRRQRRTPPDRGQACGVDRAIARLATDGDGVFDRDELLALGLSPAAIDHRVRTGRLIVVHRGVYTVGHEALNTRGRLRAALLAGGPTAALSHLTAGWLWKLIASLPAFLDITVTRRGPRSRPGLRIHSTRRSPDVRIVDSLPVTAPLRTLIDLAPTQPKHALERMCAEALVLKLVTHEELDAAGILDPELVAPTRSAFERVFFAALRQAGLPQPSAGYQIGRYTADFAWPAQRVIVETDGWRFHGNRVAFEDDRARDAYLAARGWIVVRVTWRRLKREPTVVLVQLAQTLALRASTLHGHAA